MKTFEVVLAKPSKVKDWCIWDGRDIYIEVPTTTAIIVAFNESRLDFKIKCLYPDVDVISKREIKL